MAEHESATGATDEWYTPPEIFRALGMRFDLDPCSPHGLHWVPARVKYTRADNGLVQPWHGTVFMNPPYGGRNEHLPWIERFLEHGCGIAVLRAYTSCAWWHTYAPAVDGILFPRGKTKFIRADGTIGGSPGHGVAFWAMGDACVRALRSSGLGMYWNVNSKS